MVNKTAPPPGPKGGRSRAAAFGDVPEATIKTPRSRLRTDDPGAASETAPLPGPTRGRLRAAVFGATAGRGRSPARDVRQTHHARMGLEDVVGAGLSLLVGAGLELGDISTAELGVPFSTGEGWEMLSVRGCGAGLGLRLRDIVGAGSRQGDIHGELLDNVQH